MRYLEYLNEIIPSEIDYCIFSNLSYVFFFKNS